MDKCQFTKQDAEVVDQIGEVLEEMKFTIEDGFCNQSSLGYRVTCDHGELPFKALITYDPKEGVILIQIAYRVIISPNEFQSSYAHLNNLNSELILGHFALCRYCGELTFNSGFYNKTQYLFKKKLQANLEQILEEACLGNSSLSEALSSPTQDNYKEDKNI